MSGAELAVVLAAVAIVVAAVVLGVVGVHLRGALRELRGVLSEIQREVLPAVARLEEASGQVSGEVKRVGGLLDVAERVSERAETLSRLTYRALVEPFAAVASAFRRGAEEATPPDAATSDAATPGAVGAPRRRVSWPRRRVSWPRRRASGPRGLAGQLLSAGYRSASARLAARVAVSQTPRGGTPVARPAGAAAPTARARGAPGIPLPIPLTRQLLDAAREVTDEISAALAEGREILRADRRRADPPA